MEEYTRREIFCHEFPFSVNDRAKEGRRYSPERPPDVEAHRVQPEERSQEEEVSHDC